ncbi:MAG: 5-(carboxyamino)imidazole ribonucleotide synthase [Flavobacteriales bacterium]|nr:5-(carboxyamino)imidazole ribonucleotide synthase [Flavobacteriales bacterium]
MSSKWYGEDMRIGLLGGGQLGRMLLQEAIDLNIHLHCLDPDKNAPCAKIAHSFTVGSLTDYETVINFGKDKHLISVEIENVNVEALKSLEKSGVKVFPQPHILELIQDKGLQKQFYQEHQIPTAPFILVENKSELMEKATFPIVHKLRKGGYDGKGVNVLKTTQDADNSFDAPSILEEKIPFVKELSVIVARTENGQTKTFPAVECEFNPEANLVEFLFAPAEISPEIEKQAANLAVELIEKLGMVGLLAVEFFLDENGNLLVNEIAPRPHNSGHHTIECNITSQFAQHLRAILNLPLGSTEILQAGAMINLLGERGFEGKAVYEGLNQALELEGVYPHIYGKEITKPFRKMGHVTITDSSIEKVKVKAKKVQRLIKVVSDC